MVAFHPHFALVAASLASLSLVPSADAAAINSRPASKQVRQLPMPLRARTSAERGFGVKSSRQEQVHFSNHRHSDARDVSECRNGHVNITQANSDGTSMPIGYLLLNNATTPPELDASTTNKTMLDLVRSDNSRCTLQKAIYVPAQNTTVIHCATYNQQPRTPEPLKMCPCDAPQSCGPNASQDFSYDPETGDIEPIWSSSNDTDVNDQSPAARDAPPTNVTLVWVPEECPVSAQEVAPLSASSATMTATITTTVTMYSSSAVPSSTTGSSSSAASGVSRVPSPPPPPPALNVEVAVPSSTDPAAASPDSSAIASSASSAPSVPSDTVAPNDSTGSPSSTASADAAASSVSSPAQALYVAPQW